MCYDYMTIAKYYYHIYYITIVLLVTTLLYYYSYIAIVLLPSPDPRPSRRGASRGPGIRAAPVS